MNIAYTVWIENLNAPILRGQVLDVLKDIEKQLPEGAISLFLFQSIYTIISNRKDFNNLKDELKSSGIHLIVIPSLILPKPDWFNARWYTVPLIFLQTFPILLHLSYFRKIDILHCRSYPIMLAATTTKKILPNLKLIFDPRSPFPEENITAGRWTEKSISYRMWKYLETKFLKDSDITIAITNTFVKHFNRTAQNFRFAIIPNNVNIKKFNPNTKHREHFRSEFGLKDDEILFVYSGSLGNHWNNPNVYAKFIIKLRELDLKHRFLFITPNTICLEEVFNQFKINSSEYFAISADITDMPKYLSIADFGLNLMEDQDIRMSIKTCEYLAMGLPIIINSNVLGAKEIIDQDEVGYVIKSLEAINIEEIRYFLQNKDSMISKCRNVALNKFSTNKVAREYIKAYKSL